MISISPIIYRIRKLHVAKINWLLLVLLIKSQKLLSKNKSTFNIRFSLLWFSKLCLCCYLNVSIGIIFTTSKSALASLKSLLTCFLCFSTSLGESAKVLETILSHPLDVYKIKSYCTTKMNMTFIISMWLFNPYNIVIVLISVIWEF